MDFLTKLSGCELVSLASIVSIILSEPLNTDELTVLAIFITTIGDNLALIASSRGINEENNTLPNSSNNTTNC